MQNEHTETGAREIAANAECLVSFRTNASVEIQGPLLQISPYRATFEIHNPEVVLRLSEAFKDFRIVGQGRSVYRGKAIVSGLVNAGAALICEVSLSDGPGHPHSPSIPPDLGQLTPSFRAFFGQWQESCRVRAEYKLAVVDLQRFLQDFRLWLDHVELGVLNGTAESRPAMERAMVRDLIGCVGPVLKDLFERLELAASAVPAELEPAHFRFCRRQLHPLLLASPFMRRIYLKPLGYAGDYEMVSMILRDPCEGSSIFAKILNVFILRQAPAEAHRNRVARLIDILVLETMRHAQQNLPCRVFSVGCGPAAEVQEFLVRHGLSDRAEFTLLDADEETIGYTRGVLAGLRARHGRMTSVRAVKMSVQRLLRLNGKLDLPSDEYDLIYSAGLFDYLSDEICRWLISRLYRMLAPGGLLLVTNVEPTNPIRHVMEHLYEWHLIYRNGKQLAALASFLPMEAPRAVSAELTGGNVFLEIRKPLAK